MYRLLFSIWLFLLLDLLPCSGVVPFPNPTLRDFEKVAELESPFIQAAANKTLQLHEAENVGGKAERLSKVLDCHVQVCLAIFLFSLNVVFFTLFYFYGQVGWSSIFGIMSFIIMINNLIIIIYVFIQQVAAGVNYRMVLQVNLLNCTVEEASNYRPEECVAEQVGWLS